MTRGLQSPDSGRQTFVFNDPFVLKKAQGATSFLQIFFGKTISRKSRPPKSPTNQARQLKSFQRTSELSYRGLSGVNFKDRINKTDELRLVYSGITFDEHEKLIGELRKDREVEVIFGVRGVWHERRRMIVREIEPKYDVKITVTFTLHDTGAKASDGEQTKTFTNKRLSYIFEEVARLAGMKSQVEISQDPIIPFLAMGRRSVAKTVVDLATKYGLASRFTNNVLYVQELKLDDAPNAQYIFGGPRGNVLSLKIKGSVAGLKGSKTTAKRRKDGKGKTKDSKTADDANDTLKITYKEDGSYTKRQNLSFTNQTFNTRRVIDFSGTTFNLKKPRERAKDKGRTVNTPRTGPDAARVAKGAHLARTLKVKSGSLVVINRPITPNSNLKIIGISKVFGGKFYAGDVEYKWDKGVWRVSTKVNGQRMKSGSGKGKAKNQRGNKKKQGEKLKAKSGKPKILITYKNNGTYQKAKVGYKKARQ